MMDERRLHSLRNEINVLTLGLLVLRGELDYSDRRELLDALDRMERAVARCADLIEREAGERAPRT